MKIRSGFVSNSSSSSFICAAFPVSELKKPVDVRKEVECCTNQRELDKLALEFFNDGEAGYVAYRNGTIPVEFWEFAYKERFGSGQAVPSGLISFERDDVEYLGKKIGPSVEYGTEEIDPYSITDTIQELKAKYGVKHVKLFLTHEDC